MCARRSAHHLLEAAVTLDSDFRRFLLVKPLSMLQLFFWYVILMPTRIRGECNMLRVALQTCHIRKADILLIQ